MQRLDCTPTEALRYLDAIGCGKKEALAEVKASLRAICKALPEILFQKCPYAVGPDALAVVPSPSEDQQIARVVSELLMVPETTASCLWSSALKKQFPSFSPSTATPSSLAAVRRAALTYREQAWLLLHELLRIDMGDQHAYHSEAKGMVSQLLDDGFVPACLAHLTALSQWVPRALSQQAIAEPSAQYVDHLLALVTDLQMLLDALMLLFYHRSTLSLADLADIFACFRFGSFSALLGLQEAIGPNADLSRQMDEQVAVLRVQVLCLAVEGLQVYRLYTSEEVAPAEDEGDLLDALDEQMPLLGDQLPRIVCALLKRCTPADAEYDEQEDYTSSEVLVVEELHALLCASQRSVCAGMLSPNTPNSIGGISGNAFVYASLLAEAVQYAIHFEVLGAGSGGPWAMPQHLPLVTPLIQLVYTSSGVLADNFWESNASPTEGNPSTPLGMLVDALLQQSAFGPALLPMLTALSASASAQHRCTVIELLNRPVFLCTIEQLSDLQGLEEMVSMSEDSILARVLPGTADAPGSQVTCIRSTDRIAAPVYGDHGRVLRVEEQALVLWERQVIWWTVLVEAIAHAEDAMGLSNGILSLLAALLVDKSLLLVTYLLQTKQPDLWQRGLARMMAQQLAADTLHHRGGGGMSRLSESLRTLRGLLPIGGQWVALVLAEVGILLTRSDKTLTGGFLSVLTAVAVKYPDSQTLLPLLLDVLSGVLLALRTGTVNPSAEPSAASEEIRQVVLTSSEVLGGLLPHTTSMSLAALSAYLQAVRHLQQLLGPDDELGLGLGALLLPEGLVQTALQMVGMLPMLACAAPVRVKRTLADLLAETSSTNASVKGLQLGEVWDRLPLDTQGNRLLSQCALTSLSILQHADRAMLWTVLAREGCLHPVAGTLIDQQLLGGAGRSYFMLLCTDLLYVSLDVRTARGIREDTLVLIKDLLTGSLSARIGELISMEQMPVLYAVLQELLSNREEVVIEILAALAEHSPEVLGLLIACKPSNGLLTACACEDNVFIKHLAALLSASTYPSTSMLIAVYKLLLAMLHRVVAYSSLAAAILHLATSSRFWEIVSYPLTVDLQDAEDIAVDIPDSLPGLEEVLNTPEGVEDIVQRHLPTLSTASSQSAVLHALSLQILSLERYGVLYDLSVPIASKCTVRMDALYVKMTSAHRWSSWIKRYLPKDKTTSALAANSTGSNVQMIVTSYQLSLAGILPSEHTLVLLRDHALASASAAQQEIENTQQTLLDAFSRFLEVFVLPGSAFKQLIVSLKASSASSGAASPEPGSLSPVVTASMNSPTSSRPSSFSGDRRSYELVTVLLDHLEAAPPTARHMPAKACLLLSMLHHQLREVSYLTADPGDSQLLPREMLGRLTESKVLRYAARVLGVYKTLGGDLNDGIKTRITLLTILTLLLSHTTEEVRGVREAMSEAFGYLSPMSGQSGDMLQLYQLIVQLLVLSGTSSGVLDHVLTAIRCTSSEVDLEAFAYFKHTPSAEQVAHLLGRKGVRTLTLSPSPASATSSCTSLLLLMDLLARTSSGVQGVKEVVRVLGVLVNDPLTRRIQQGLLEACTSSGVQSIALSLPYTSSGVHPGIAYLHKVLHLLGSVLARYRTQPLPEEVFEVVQALLRTHTSLFTALLLVPLAGPLYTPQGVQLTQAVLHLFALLGVVMPAWPRGLVSYCAQQLTAQIVTVLKQGQQGQQLAEHVVLVSAEERAALGAGGGGGDGSNSSSSKRRSRSMSFTLPSDIITPSTHGHAPGAHVRFGADEVFEIPHISTTPHTPGPPPSPSMHSILKSPLRAHPAPSVSSAASSTIGIFVKMEDSLFALLGTCCAILRTSLVEITTEVVLGAQVTYSHQGLRTGMVISMSDREVQIIDTSEVVDTVPRSAVLYSSTPLCAFAPSHELHMPEGLSDAVWLSLLQGTGRAPTAPSLSTAHLVQLLALARGKGSHSLAQQAAHLVLSCLDHLTTGIHRYQPTPAYQHALLGQLQEIIHHLSVDEDACATALLGYAQQLVLRVSLATHQLPASPVPAEEDSSNTMRRSKKRSGLRDRVDWVRPSEESSIAVQ